MKKDIVIEVWETGTAATKAFEFNLAVEGEVVMSRRLTPVQTLEIREISAQYSSLFAGGERGKNGYLHLLGESLFRLFIQPEWQQISTKIPSGGRLLVASSIPEVLQLPWELLLLPDGKAQTAGLFKDFAVLRLPVQRARPSSSSPSQPSSSQPSSSQPSPPQQSPFFPSHELRAGPLRMLFLSADPQHFEEEDLSLLRAVQGLDIRLQIGETASFEELKESIKSLQPHLVYFSGEANLSAGTSGREAGFAFMDPAGKPDMRSAEEIAHALEGGGVECIILGGGRRGPDPARDLLCQRLAEDLSVAVAWNGSFAPQGIISPLSQGLAVHEAIWGRGREILKKILGGDEDGKEGAIQAYPFIYLVREPRGLFDPHKEREEEEAGYQMLPPMPGMTEGHADGFVNRRRDLHRLYPDLRQGISNTLIITGEPGRGKSALANRLARMLAASGYLVIPLGGSIHNPISSARLLEAAGRQLAAASELQGRERTNGLLNSALPAGERLAALMELLRSNRILILWDDLDLEEETGRISDPHLGELFQQMVKGLRSSRAIITCSEAPADVPILPRLARSWRLDMLSQAAFLRFVLQDRATGERYRNGELSFDALADLYAQYKRDPSGLEQIRSALAEGLPFGGDPLSWLLESLSPESLLTLRRMAVYDVAMSAEGLAAAAMSSPERINESLPLWEELSLCHKAGELWAVHSSARAALREGLSLEERRDAHKRAGAFLEEMAEAGRSQDLSLLRLDALLEARGHYLQGGELAEARRVTFRISSYLDRRGYHSELIRLNREIAEREEEEGKEQGDGPEPDTMNWIAQAYSNQMDLENAVRWYRRALDIAPNAISYQGLGMINLSQGEYDQAEENLQKAEQFYLSRNDRRGEAAVLQALASIDMAQKSGSAAKEKLGRAARILEELGDKMGEAAVLQKMAGIDMMRRHFDSARPSLARSLELAREMGDRAGEAVLLFNLADLDRETGELARAAGELDQALAITRELGDSKGTAASLHGLGMILSQAGEKEKAAEHFREALSTYQELEDKPGEAGALFQLGALAVQMDRIGEGLRLMALSAVVLRSINSDEVKSIEPVVERLASQLNYSQDQFVAMLQEVMHSYVKDRGMGLVKRTFEDKGSIK